MSSDSEDDFMQEDVVRLSRDTKGKGKDVAGVIGPNGQENLPWVEKYRPSNMDELIAHQDIIQTITKFIDENRLPHLLFYGPPGTGKTSLILACARRLYGPKFQSMILELNASDERGIAVVREQIKEFASTRTIFSSGFKLIILDEADAMTNDAQAALRRVIEKYTKNVRFCIICNYVSKIIPALQSRCTRFRFAPLSNEQITIRLNVIIQREKVNIDEGGVSALLKLSNGDMRRVLNILQAASAAFDRIDAEAVHLTTGSPLPRDVQDILEWLLHEPFSTAFNRISSLKTAKGLALLDLIHELHEFLILLDMPVAQRIFLMDKLSTIEYNLSVGASEKVQLGSLVGAFRQAVSELTAAAAK